MYMIESVILLRTTFVWNIFPKNASLMKYPKKLIFGGFEPLYLKKSPWDRVRFLVCCSGHHYQTFLPGRPFVAPIVFISQFFSLIA